MRHDRGVTAPAHSGRILVIEDDPSLQHALSTLLRRDGFDVEVAGRGAEVPGLWATHRPDLAILDLGLPDVNGFDLLRDLRAEHDVPVIVLSGRADESDRVLALELGADDYVVKPFLNRELVARIRVRLRRASEATEPSPPETGEALRIDPGSREVFVDGAPVALTAKEFDLLHHLASSPRQVFSREQLLQAVWDSASDWQQESTVTEHVHRLRQKVGSDRIVTVRGAGYRFEPAPPTT